MKMTEKQKRFADYYIETANASEAARRAGYSEKTAHRIGQENMQKPVIRDYIEEKMAQKDKERIASQDEILQFLTSVMRGRVQETIPLGLGMGEQKLVKKELDGKDRLRAAELLGKRHAMWTDKQQVENITPVFVEDVPEDDD
ncbi:terminase small subunit [Halalkalibacterium halodurans]|uniref:terminase small subunit n=1 Tax=Halalkalibacterium halodurans TaxID=86665 RepID=UPI002E22CE1F|nr:terminase small subunit [Halalkalibacterium halodurans]MED4105517.1 terminase small subunit [Halalkalibacterium halodurans]MED4109277.1 terminase small subunit [Halalkalibacterium halodurans]MED4149709.1 terminase small subunit [Halalkalibacterium halodurans]